VLTAGACWTMLDADDDETDVTADEKEQEPPLRLLEREPQEEAFELSSFVMNSLCDVAFRLSPTEDVLLRLVWYFFLGRMLPVVSASIDCCCCCCCCMVDRLWDSQL
jgi:hypothetical protein